MAKTIHVLKALVTSDMSQLTRESRNAVMALNRMGHAWKRTARDVSTAATRITGAIALIGGVALKQFAQFERSIKRVGIVTGVLRDETGKLSGEFHKLERAARVAGQTTEFTALQSAQAMEKLGLAGLKASEVITALPAVLQLATAGQLSIAQAADIAARTMRAFGLEAGELGRVNDVLVGTFTKTNTTLEQLAEGMKLVAPVAKTAGLSIEETSAILGAMGNAGLQGSLGGTALRVALIRLASPSKKAAELLKNLGVQAGDTFFQKLRKIKFAIDGAANSTEKLTFAADLFGVRGAPGMLAAMEAGIDRLEKFSKSFEEGIGARTQQELINTLTGQMNLLKSAITELFIETGGKLNPAFRDMIQLFTDFFIVNKDEVVRALADAFNGLVHFVRLAFSAFRDLGPALLEAGRLASAFLGPLLDFLKNHPQLLAALIVLRVTGFLGLNQAILSLIVSLFRTAQAFFAATTAAWGQAAANTAVGTTAASATVATTALSGALALIGGALVVGAIMGTIALIDKLTEKERKLERQRAENHQRTLDRNLEERGRIARAPADTQRKIANIKARDPQGKKKTQQQKNIEGLAIAEKALADNRKRQQRTLINIQGIENRITAIQKHRTSASFKRRQAAAGGRPLRLTPQESAASATGAEEIEDRKNQIAELRKRLKTLKDAEVEQEKNRQNQIDKIHEENLAARERRQKAAQDKRNRAAQKAAFDAQQRLREMLEAEAAIERERDKRRERDAPGQQAIKDFAGLPGATPAGVDEFIFQRTGKRGGLGGQLAPLGKQRAKALEQGRFKDAEKISEQMSNLIIAFVKQINRAKDAAREAKKELEALPGNLTKIARTQSRYNKRIKETDILTEKAAETLRRTFTNALIELRRRLVTGKISSKEFSDKLQRLNIAFQENLDAARELEIQERRSALLRKDFARAGLDVDKAIEEKRLSANRQVFDQGVQKLFEATFGQADAAQKQLEAARKQLESARTGPERLLIISRFHLQRMNTMFQNFLIRAKRGASLIPGKADTKDPNISVLGFAKAINNAGRELAKLGIIRQKIVRRFEKDMFQVIIAMRNGEISRSKAINRLNLIRARLLRELNREIENNTQKFRSNSAAQRQRILQIQRQQEFQKRIEQRRRGAGGTQAQLGGRFGAAFATIGRFLGTQGGRAQNLQAQVAMLQQRLQFLQQSPFVGSGRQMMAVKNQLKDLFRELNTILFKPPPIFNQLLLGDRGGFFRDPGLQASGGVGGINVQVQNMNGQDLLDGINNRLEATGHQRFF